MEFQKRTVIYNMLKSLFPKQCKIVGDANIKNIVAGHTEPINGEGGSNFDITIFLAILSAAAEIGSLAYDIFKKDKNISPEDVQKHIIDPSIKQHINIDMKNVKADQIIINIKQTIQNDSGTSPSGNETSIDY